MGAYGYPQPQQPYGGYQQPMYQQPYVPMNPMMTNEQRYQQIINANPQLASQLGIPQSMIQQQQPQTQPMIQLKGRPVTSIEEARAAQIDLDGSVHVFTDVANNRIYTKQLGLNGAAIFDVYERQVQAQVPPSSTTPILSMQDLETMCNVLTNKVSVLESKLNEMGGNNNGNEPNAVVRNASKQRKSDGNATADVGE